MMMVLAVTSLVPAKPFSRRAFRVYRRRRLKINSSLPPSPAPFENLFRSLIAHYPSVNSLDLITPALGFASGAALFFSSRANSAAGDGQRSSLSDLGEWILFATPTPFNRFVLLRCPSLVFEGSEASERHYVSGRIEVRRGREREGLAEELRYQRVCVSGADGGVVSLDWPDNLDLEEERGLDSTLLLVPGTPQGSMDADVRLFVVEALKRGFFPVVMNPRGCAASPLTTPRLFTAADSDDICTSITYISKARPWTTLMGVGWGYGANMLTKYLAEVGESTPLTAATCIDNPFDLDEATRSFPYHIVTDQKLTNGLIDILQTNKALFQGKTKGFDVEKALLANSVRDFEEAISMVSYGFGAIEDFYSKSSTRNMIRDVKIPVLFIQSDNGMVPGFSVPRNLIAENPFTSLLLCSRLPPSVTDTDMSALSWCQLLTIEWLTAVELGLLKGRHPLLTDIDVTINPSKGLVVVEEIRSNKEAKVGKLLNLTRSDAFNGYSIDPSNDFLEENKNNTGLQFRSQQSLQPTFDQDMSLKVKDGPSQQTSSSDADLIEEENVSSVDNVEVLQTAQVVINMLDVTMPGTLTEERKKKVLTAVGQGQTLMKALHDAVPEDVRGKLTDAVTGILHAKGSNLKVGRILNVSQSPEPLPGQKNQEKSRVLDAEVMVEDQPSVNQMKKASPVDGSDNAPGSIGELAEGTETEVIPIETPNSTNLAQSQALNDEVGSSSSTRKETESSDNNDTNEELNGKAVPNVDHSKNGFETGSKPYNPSHPDGAGFESASVGEQKSQDSGTAQIDPKEESNTLKDEQKNQDFSINLSKNTSTDAKEEPFSPSMSEENSTLKDEQKNQDFSINHSKNTSTDAKEPFSPSISSDHPTMERKGNDNDKKDNKNTQHVAPQTNSNNLDSSAPAFSVSQALDALAGMDDSTQVAVNSVFGVIENMISHLEQSSENEEVKDGKDVEHKIEGKQKTNSQRKDSNTSTDPSVDDHHNEMYSNNGSCHIEEQPPQSLGEISRNSVLDSHSCNSNNSHLVQKESNTNTQLIDKRFLIDKWDGHREVDRMPEFIAAGSYGGSPYNENLRKYLVSKTPVQPLDLNTTTALLLDYFPEEGQWKLFEQTQKVDIASSNTETGEEAGPKTKAPSSSKSSNAEQYIEPPYVILDSEKQQEPVKEFITTDTENRMTDTSDDRSDEFIQFVKKKVLHSLKMEVGRKLNAAEMIEMKSDLAEDLEHVASAISQAALHCKMQQLHTESQGLNVEDSIKKVGTLEGEHIVSVISSSVQQTNCLRKVVPLGVIVGSILASLRKYFDVTTLHDDQKRSLIHDDVEKPSKKNHGIGGAIEIDQVLEEKTSLDHPIQTETVESDLKDTSKNTVMVGAVTAALGASALLVQQKDLQQENITAESSATYLKMENPNQKEPDRLQEEVFEKNQNNIVTSLAEKAMSVAGPVVPTKDGEVDQERLVAMLADLGQRGGLLRLVGKIALLWGGIRGAMSLTDRLISFLRVAERPLFQRIFGFVGMMLVLWSPVAIPLLPTIVQSWTTKTSSKIAEFACIVGLYTAIVILVMLWGKRIRGYENAFEQYGLDLTSPRKLFEFLEGLVGGAIFIFSIHAVNAFLGFASFSWPHIPTSLDAITWLKVYGHMGLVVVQGTVMATAIALVEELLFRSWLPQEIAVDLGYHQGIIISGMAFSFLQRSLQAIPGLWLLGLSLSGARQRNGGSLFIPIGLRTGMMASTYMLQKGGFLIYHNKGNLPLWIIGSHPFQPFSGLVGLVFSLSLAILLYPRQTLQRKEAQE